MLDQIGDAASKEFLKRKSIPNFHHSHKIKDAEELSTKETKKESKKEGKREDR